MVGSTGGGGAISGKGINSDSLATSSSETITSGACGISINSAKELDGISARLIITFAGPVEPPRVEEIGSSPLPCSPDRVTSEATLSAFPSLLTKISAVPLLIASISEGTM